jgi:glutathione S-transferase
MVHNTPMRKPLLIIGNKNYSSWSLRPYMVLSMAGIPFDEELIRFGEPDFSRAVTKISSAGQVPILLHNDIVINDSMAIIEYAAETWPSKGIWPKNIDARAKARSACAEMHSGFHAIRSACPMNLRRPKKLPPGGVTDAMMKNLTRLETLWAECRKTYGKPGSYGPFLFGRFCAADAMFMPMATRIDTFQLPVNDEARAYVDALLETPAFQEWKADSESEKWIVPEDEVD